MENPMRRQVLNGIAALFACCALPALGQGEPASKPVKREIIPGSELMTSGERERYRRRMREARRPEEETRVREEHVKQMRERARLRGLSLAEPQKESAR